jgi:flagellar protein FlgJ
MIKLGNEATLKTQQQAARQKLDGLKSKLNKNTIKNMSEFDAKRLKESCYDLEGLFINQMMKVMRNNVPKGGLFTKSQAENIFEDMLYEQYSNKMARTQSNGLAVQIYEQLTKTI